MIYTVLQVKKENRKQFPVAIAAFIDRNKADKYARNYAEQNNLSLDDDEVFVEGSHYVSQIIDKPYTVFDEIEHDYRMCIESNMNKIGNKIYLFWCIESKRPVTGFATYVFDNDKNVKIYTENIWPDEEVASFTKGYYVLECDLIR